MASEADQRTRQAGADRGKPTLVKVPEPPKAPSTAKTKLKDIR